MKNVVVLLLASVPWIACRPAHAPEVSPGTGVETAEPAPAPANEPPAARLEELRAALADVTAELNQGGEYNCCVHPPCTWCALHEGTCTCFDNLQQGAEVCPGCGLGWHNGQGVVEGIDATDVKWNITHEHGESGGHGH